MAALDSWRFCPRCSAEVSHDSGSVSCESCGFEHFSNPTPAVSAFVLDDSGRVLLARRAHEPDAGLWDTPGGFLDEDEEAVDGLRRELLEETGLTIEVGEFVGTHVDRYGSGDDAPAVLNLVWTARVLEGEPEPADDVSELRWFSADELPARNELAFRWLYPALRAWAADSP